MIANFTRIVAVLFLLSTTTVAQSTYSSVYNILNSNCSGSGCHGGASPVLFNVDGSSGDLYNALVDATPADAVAAAKGDKLVDGGHPATSYLLRKIGNSISNELTLSAGETETEASAHGSLSDAQIEIIRQWIIRDAPETGTVINEQLINDYYNGGGVPKMIQPSGPDPNEGFQIHLGPLFFEPQEEKEFFNKFDLRLQDDIEVVRMEVIMNDESHHFILYKFDGAQASVAYNDGLRDFSVTEFFNNDTDFLMAWQNDDNVELPEGTAYFWRQGDALDLNYHVSNYHTDQILPADVYVNIYTQPSGTAEAEMQSALFNNALLFIPANNQVTPFSQTESWSGTKSIWNIVSHTHKYGIDYDVFLRNANGSKGNQIYEGFYNFDYTFNQGFFEWDHPPVKYFEPLLEVDHGLIHEAKYKNYGSSPVTFGFTTDDEMMIIYVQYVEGSFQIPVDTTNVGIADIDAAGDLDIFPNPFKGSTQIGYSLTQTDEVQVDVLDVVGKKIATLVSETQSPGDYQYTFAPADYTSNGLYFVRFTVGDKVTTRKLIELK